MSSLSLQTIIRYKDYNIYEFNSENIIQLNDGSILVYTTSQILRMNGIFNITLLKDFQEPYSTRSIKQLKNNKILFCNQNLYELDIKTKEINKIPVSKKDINIYDIIELKNGKIIGITDEYLINIELSSKNINFEKTIVFKIPDEFLLYENMYFDKNYSYLYLLEGNKLLIHRFRAHNDNRSKCGNCRRPTHYSNIIFVLNLDNFEILHEFQHFNGEINIVVLKNYICISYYNAIYIYDINDFKEIKEINAGSFDYYVYIFKYDENMLITTNKYISNEIEIVIYDLSNINKIKIASFKNEFMNVSRDICYRDLFKNKIIHKLKDNKILLNIFPFIYILELPKYFKFKNFKGKEKNL